MGQVVLKLQNKFVVESQKKMSYHHIPQSICSGLSIFCRPRTDAVAGLSHLLNQKWGHKE